MTTTDPQQSEHSGDAADIKAVPVRHPGRWLSTVIVLFILAMFVRSLISNPNYEWGVVRDTLTTHTILVGLLHTVELTVLCMAIGIVGGVILAIMRLSANPVLSTVSWVYIWFFRGTPLLVQILFWGFLGALYKTITVGIPFGGPEFGSWQTKDVITVYMAAVLGLALNEAAYMAEIVRAGIVSVDEGQVRAAQSLGMSKLLAMRRIVLPQAMRLIIPPTGNEAISMLKNTSLVSVIAYSDLLYAAQLIYSRTYQTVPVLIAASIWYLLVTSVLTAGQFYVERHFGKGSSRELPPTPLQRIRRMLYSGHAASPSPAPAPPMPLGGGGQR